MPPIPPYEYPESPPVARSAPGDSPKQVPEQPKKSKPELKRPPHGPPPPKPVIEHVSPVTPVVPEKQPVQQVVMSHPETVTLPPVQEVVRQPKPVASEPNVLTPPVEKQLTPVKQKASERFDEDSTKQPQVNKSPLNLSQPNLPRKFTKKLKFKGRPGRQRTDAQVEDLLTYVQAGGVWPDGVSDQMRRYYRREYPEYFRKTRKRKVQTHRSTPIDFQARRSGTGN